MGDLEDLVKHCLHVWSRGVVREEDFPTTESLKDLIEHRTVPFWIAEVQPRILGKVIASLNTSFKHYCVAGEAVLCVAHGTSLRGIVKHIEQLSDEEICSLDLPNGIPIVYRSGH